MSIKCEFGCGKDALYKFKTGKYQNKLCCSQYVFRCPAFNKQQRDKVWIKEYLFACDCNHRMVAMEQPARCPKCRRSDTWIHKEQINVRPGS